MQFKFPHIDLFSFWFGFVLATLFWLILLRISRLLPKMRKSVAANREKKAIERSFTQEHEVQKFMLRKAQKSHLAGALFPLERVTIEPKFLSHPILELGDEEFESLPTIYRVLPSMPETPEITADLPVLKYSFSDLLVHHQYISISGNEGCGKTSAMAFLTTQLVTNPDRHDELPIFLDYREIESESKSAVVGLADSIAQQMTGQNSDTITRILNAAASQKRLTVMIDSLDELGQSALEQGLQWIRKLQSELPNAKIILSCNPFFTGSLESAGFSIFTLAAWGMAERRQYLALWRKAWQEYCKALPAEQKINAIERGERISLWLAKNDQSDSPLDCALRNWLAFSGAFDQNEPVSLYAAYYRYALGGQTSVKALELIADLVKNSPRQMFQLQNYLDCMLSNAELVKPQSLEFASNDLSGSPETKPASSIDFQVLLQELLSLGFFKEVSPATYCFSHMVFQAHLTRETLPANPLPKLSQILTEPADQIRFKLTQPEKLDQSALFRWLSTPDIPLQRNLLLAENWLSGITSITPVRGELLKRIALVLQDSHIPIEIRYRFLANLTRAREPSIGSLFGYLRSNPDPTVRQLSALGLGLLLDEKHVPLLKELSHDRSNEVQQIACLSLGNIWSTTAQDTLVDVIFSADEFIREVACQILAFKPPEGHQMLKEITETDNYLAKKAAISGLLFVHEDWVKPIFEKLSVEDTQWLVRDAAGFALEKLNIHFPLPPEPILPVLENPWTLKKAEEYGTQLPASGFPADLLIKVLNLGELRDQSIALRYLLTQPNELLFEWLRHPLNQTQTLLTEEIINAFFVLGQRGMELSGIAKN